MFILREISIRAPLAGSDREEIAQLRYVEGISIRAPLAGSDGMAKTLIGNIKDFNPRSPCGERLVIPSVAVFHALFQSALPLRGATVRGTLVNAVMSISIRAPLAGSDRYIL